MIWRERRVLLIILGILLAANTIFFFTYRVQYEQRLGDLDTRIAESETQLQKTRETRQLAERQYAAYRKVQKDIEEVYNERWSTQSARLAPLITEVKRLATASQLTPPTYTFSVATTKSDTTGTLNTSVVGISFGVQGTYQQIRRLINLLELSPQFVIIDSIALSSANDQNLSLTIHVKTLFRDTSPRVAGTATQQL
jgi:Tfp pilus assembly protein PilO